MEKHREKLSTPLAHSALSHWLSLTKPNLTTNLSPKTLSPPRLRLKKNGEPMETHKHPYLVTKFPVPLPIPVPQTTSSQSQAAFALHPTHQIP